MQHQQIKEKVKERYGTIALTGNSNCGCCCAPAELKDNDNDNCCSSPSQSATTIIGYNNEELQSIPKESILGVGCGAPVHFAELREAETVVDLGSRRN